MKLPTTTLPDGEAVPRLGQGTWHMGEQTEDEQKEVGALIAGLDQGLRLIDTAEMYADGGAEAIVAQAIRGRRDDAFIVSKVYPHNAGRQDAVKSCEQSLKRLKIDTIDLYLLHWRGGVPFAETIEVFERLRDSGKIRHFGVSNLDVDDLEQWVAVDGGEKLAANQVLYNLERRWPEWRLLQWCQQRQIPVMAYTPLEPAIGNVNPVLTQIGNRHDATPAQIALAWVVQNPGVIAIPKASSLNHVADNARVFDIKLTALDNQELDQVWPAPAGPAGIEMI